MEIVTEFPKAEVPSCLATSCYVKTVALLLKCLAESSRRVGCKAKRGATRSPDSLLKRSILIDPVALPSDDSTPMS